MLIFRVFGTEFPFLPGKRQALRYIPVSYTHLELKYCIKNVSAERIRDEFIKIVTGRNAENVLRKYADVIAVFIQEIKDSFGFEQFSPYHKYDVWEHTIHAVGAAADVRNVKIAMFFHDISKPECFKMDEGGRGHFKGHAHKSAEKAEKILKRLKFPGKDIKDISEIDVYKRQIFHSTHL